MLITSEGSTSTQDHNAKKERRVGGEGEVGEEGEEKKASQQTSKTPVHITTSDSTKIDVKFSKMKAYTYYTFLGL